MSLLRSLSLAAVLAAVVVSSGCVVAPVVPPRGIFFTDQVAPLFEGGRTGSRRGESECKNVMFMVGWGDGGIRAAVENGNITEIRHVDYRFMNIGPFYQKYTTIVYGE